MTKIWTSADISKLIRIIFGIITVTFRQAVRDTCQQNSSILNTDEFKSNRYRLVPNCFLCCDYTATAQRLHCDCTATALRLHGHCTTTARRLHGDCTATAPWLQVIITVIIWYNAGVDHNEGFSINRK